MRLICPHCMSGVTVSDDTAGKEATCPNCGKSFPTPARYSADVVPEAAVSAVAGAIDPVRSSPHPDPAAPAPAPVPPPGYVPPAPPAPAGAPPVDPSGFLTSTPAAEVHPAPGYTHARGLTVSPQVVAWLPAICLLLTLVFTMFPWVGSYAGHTAVYSQRPWGAMFGGVKRNFTLERVVPIPGGWLDKVTSDWALMLPYLVCLILGVMLAWGDRGLNAFDPQRYRFVAKVWPHRQAVILSVATLALLLSLVQVFRGFGMERAMRGAVEEKFAAQRQQHANSPAELERVEYEVDQEYAKFNLEHTTWAELALMFNTLAVAAAVGRFLLDRRGNKPPPRIVLHY